MFYNGKLGFPATFTDAETLTISAGASELIFRHEHGFTGIYHFAFNVPVNRLAKARAYLEEQGIPILADANGKTMFNFDFWNAHALYFRDPAGNIAEFIARQELPASIQNSNVSFAPADEVISIGEIGLPVEDPLTLAAYLRESTSIATYRESNPNFVPLGDANGLFIIVSEGRVWYPDTGIAAQSLPVAVTVVNSLGAHSVVRGMPYSASRID